MYELLYGDNSAGNPDLATDATNTDAVVARQHFIDFFVGKGVDTSIWKTNWFGGGTIGIGHGHQAGCQLVTATGNNSKITLTFNNIYPFDQHSSSIIGVTSTHGATTTGNFGSDFGLWGAGGDATEADAATLKNNTAEGDNMQFFTKNGSSGVTDTSVYRKTQGQWFATKIDLKESKADCCIDGYLRATRTSGLPNKALMPWFKHTTYSGGVATTGSIRYVEAWNN